MKRLSLVIFTIITITTFVLVLPYTPFYRIATGGSEGVILEWKDLRGLNTESGKASMLLNGVNGGRVKIAGFIVPLEDNMEETSEFLLVPYPQACIHVPAPPANQIVHVIMHHHTTVPTSYGRPVWAEGILQIKDVESQYATSSFFMDGMEVSRYRDYYENEYLLPLISPCESEYSWKCLRLKMEDIYYTYFGDDPY